MRRFAQHLSSDNPERTDLWRDGSLRRKLVFSFEHCNTHSCGAGAASASCSSTLFRLFSGAHQLGACLPGYSPDSQPQGLMHQAHLREGLRLPAAAEGLPGSPDTGLTCAVAPVSSALLSVAFWGPCCFCRLSHLRRLRCGSYPARRHTSFCWSVRLFSTLQPHTHPVEFGISCLVLCAVSSALFGKRFSGDNCLLCVLVAD